MINVLNIEQLLITLFITICLFMLHRLIAGCQHLFLCLMMHELLEDQIDGQFDVPCCKRCQRYIRFGSDPNAFMKIHIDKLQNCLGRDKHHYSPGSDQVERSAFMNVRVDVGTRSWRPRYKRSALMKVHADVSQYQRGQVKTEIFIQKPM